ncbi:hypothetical protein ACHAPF_002380 [Botrytis cinerea]
MSAVVTVRTQSVISTLDLMRRMPLLPWRKERVPTLIASHPPHDDLNFGDFVNAHHSNVSGHSQPVVQPPELLRASEV